MDESVFKAYDIRGVYPLEINEDMAYTIGLSYGSYLQEVLDQKKCVVGYDNRISSTSIHEALVRGLLDSNINVIDHGLVTTPMHYLGRYKEKALGIMVTASHNPKDDNGFKFSFDFLANARGQMIENFKDYTLRGNFLHGQGLLEKRSIRDDYLNYIRENIDLGSKKIRVVIDPGNGVTTTIIKDVMAMFPSIEAYYICDVSDGTFPNHHPDPAVEENMAMLKEEVLRRKADLGIAYDGDGDRLGIIDENGNYIMADKILLVAARNLLSTFNDKRILCDVKCSKALIDEVKNLGGKVVMCRTGTSYTQAKTKEEGILLGGELSGHIFFNDRNLEICSGIYDGLRICEMLTKSDKTFSEMLDGIPYYVSTPEIKIPCSNDSKFAVVEKVKEEIANMDLNVLDIDGVRFEHGDYWGLIRASNTGPNLTLRFEAKSEEKLEEIKNEFIKLVNSKL